MKKTIAKIMAAAMVLSAVPAVALPTMTAEAAAPSAVTISGIGDKTTLDADGGTGVKVAASDLTTNETVADAFVSFSGTSKDGTDANTRGGYTISGGAKDYVSNVAIEGTATDGEVVVSLSDADANLMSLVNEGKNQITIKATLAAATAEDDDDNTYAKDDEITIGTFYIGGTKKALGETIYDATDKNEYIAEKEIGVNVDLSAATAEIVKGTKDIADNDTLRGKLLELNEVYVGGVPFKVTKIGGQALKEAHMKKLEIQNTKKLGKGALRKCKQMTKVDIEDGQKVRTIHSKAFYDCKNLKTIVIDGRKLKTVGKDAFSGVKKGCTVKIKAKKSKFNSDVKMIKKNGGNKNLKYVRK